MEEDWIVIPRGDVAPHWSGLYVTLNKLGTIAISRVTHERMGEPAGYLVMLERFNRRLALKPGVPGTRHVFPARKYGRSGARVVRVNRLVREFGIRPQETIEFRRPKIDEEGRLILDLRNIRISPKAHSQCRRKKKPRFEI